MTTASPPQTGAWLPRGRAFTVADLDTLPDDGNRYELIDGALVVTPSPTPRHQHVLLEVAVLIRDACPAELEVFVAPLDVRLADDTNLQPDVLVARRSELTEKNLPVAPLLAVEILSPSTRTIDLHSKKERLRQAGCPSYWVIDPADGHFTAWELDEHDTHGEYVEVADLDAASGRTWHATRPYDVDVTPATLIDR